VQRFCWYCGEPSEGHDCVRNSKLAVEITPDDMKRWEDMAQTSQPNAEAGLFMDTPIGEIVKNAS